MTNDLLIQGNNVHVFLYIDAAPFEIVCATDMSLTTTIEKIGATTPESGTSREFRNRLEESDLVLSGCSTSDNDSDVSIFYIFNNRRDTFDIEIVFTDNGGSERSIRADMLFNSSTLNGPVDQMSGYELSLKITGAVTDTELEVPTAGDNIASDSYTVSGGVIQDNAWIGLTSANIMEVCREGSEQLSLGLPFSFNGATGTITPDPSTTIDGQRMFVLWTY